MDVPFLPFHVPEIGEEEIRSVEECLRSGWLTTGPKVREFEEAFAGFVGARHAVALNSGTAALHLALAAAGVGEGDEVIVPTMTFAATAEVVLHFKARPVLVDSTPDTLNIDPEQIERSISPKTKAIIPVHFGGHPCEMDRIQEIAKQKGLKVIEDAAHALPARHRGRMVGAIGDLTCFSFYATKPITTGEGGMLTTEDPEYAECARSLSLHGLSHDAWKRYDVAGSWHYEIHRPGYKYNMTDIAASLGIHQLNKCERFWEIRDAHARRYSERLREIPEIQVPAVQPLAKHAWHLYVIQLEVTRLSISRDKFIETLAERKIGVSVHFIPLHRQPYYLNAFGYRSGCFPVADEAYGRIISLPIYPKMSETDVDRVSTAVIDIIARHRK